MGIKTFSKKAPIQFEYDGVVFNLPGEFPILAQLKMVELQDANESDTEVTMEMVMDMYRSILGNDSAEILFNAGIGQEKLQEVLSWYIEEITKTKPQDHKSPNVSKAAKRT